MSARYDVTVSQIAAALGAIRAPIATDSGATPVIDTSGRQHAPHDGWSDECGRVYRGGEYLPEDDSREYRIKMLAAESAADALRDALADHPDVVGVSFGSPFDGLTYAYISARKSAADTLRRLTPPDRVLVAADEGLSIGKTWKYSYARDMAAAVRRNDETRPLREDLDKKIVGYYRPRVISA